MLKRFPGGTDDDRQQALREVMQEITLAGLYRAGFFEKGAYLWRHVFTDFSWAVPVLRRFGFFAS